jgi:tetratricopeptide (TPR) repeat protein
MKSTLILLFFLTFLPFAIFAQIDKSCQKLLEESNTIYYEKKYQEALTLFQKAEKCNKTLSSDDYYNGCCIASLAQNEKLAFEYLKKAIDDGWENISHMDTDTDLDFIKTKPQFSKLINQIESKYDYLSNYFKSMEQEDYDNAIPFCVNGKWGLCHKKTKKKITEPIFDYVDFRCKNNIPFIFKGQSFTLLENHKIRRETRSNNEIGFSTGFQSDRSSKIFGDSIMQGFKLVENKVTAFSNKYTNIVLIRELAWGIATRKDGIVNVITENGSKVAAFDGDYKEFKTHLLSWSTYKKPDVLFSFKKIDEDIFGIYDKSGKKLIEQRFNSVESFSDFQTTPSSEQAFVGDMSKKFLKVKIGNEFNIFYMQTNEMLFEKNYENIVMMNGPTEYVSKLPSPSNSGISEPYFLIKKGINHYYLDINGQIYKPE